MHKPVASGFTMKSKDISYSAAYEKGGTLLLLLTHCRLNELTHTIYWMILFSILGMSGYVI